MVHIGSWMIGGWRHEPVLRPVSASAWDWEYHETRAETRDCHEVSQLPASDPLTSRNSPGIVNNLQTIQCHLSVVCPRKVYHENLLMKLAFHNSNAFVVYLSVCCVNIIRRIIWSVVENVGPCFHSAIDLNNVMMMGGWDTEHNNNNKYAQCGMLIISMHTLRLWCIVYQDKALLEIFSATVMAWALHNFIISVQFDICEHLLTLHWNPPGSGSWE